jgi:GDPmannose 4,6-dehydratase
VYRKALILGITGQDGSFLAEFLLAKQYQVHGVVRRASTFNTERLDGIYADPHEHTNLFLHFGDVTDASGLRQIIEKVQPDEIYNLAAQSHVRVSFDQPEYTADVVATGTLRILDCFRDYVANSRRQVRFYQAGSSEMFGAAAPPQSESTAFYPRSPYAAAKVAAHWYAVNYREAYGLFISNGILFNHESERRGETFVTRKITRAFGRIQLGLQRKLFLGNLDARRDWGYARDYVEAMWMMLQAPEPDDYVVGSRESHSVREFLDEAASYSGLEWKDFVEIDERYKRPTETAELRADPSKIERALGWRPNVGFRELVHLMLDHDLELARQEQTLTRAGHQVVLRGTTSHG